METEPDTELQSTGQTHAFGERLAQGLRAGDVVALCGGLGAGKTHLTRGIVAGLGTVADVSSPTFALVQEYPGGRLPVFHFDFYRMKSAEEVLEIGWDEYLEAGGVCIVEWADLFPDLLPATTRWWHLACVSGDVRRIRTGFPER